MLRYLAELGETVESLLPDHEGAISEKLNIARQIVEDERLLANILTKLRRSPIYGTAPPMCVIINH